MYNPLHQVAGGDPRVGTRERTQCRTPSCADFGDVCHFKHDLPRILFNPNPCLAPYPYVACLK